MLNSTVTYDDEGNPQLAWWMNSHEDGIGWYQNGRFYLHVNWREWFFGVASERFFNEPGYGAANYWQRHTTLRIGPFAFVVETFKDVVVPGLGDTKGTPDA